MGQINRVFLDLDDTLNIFTTYLLFRKDAWPSPCSCKNYPGEFGYDIVTVYNYLSGSNVTPAQFWDIPQYVWAWAPRSLEFGLLLKCSEQLVGRENVFIATKPTEDPRCAAGKMEWIKRECPPWLHRQFMIGPPKHLLAQPGHLLVDDSEENCLDFNAAGGSSLLIPRPWNCARHLDAKKDIQEFFTKLC